MRDNVVICQKCREGKQRKKESNTKRTASARMASLDSRKKQKQLSASTSQHGSIAQQTIASNEGLPQQNPVASTSIQQQQRKDQEEEIVNQEEDLMQGCSHFYDNLASREITPIEKKIDISTQTDTPPSSTSIVENNCVGYCPFCLTKLHRNNRRHFFSKNCKHLMFYNKISNWSNVFETIQNINIDTTPFIKTLTKKRGRSSVYLIRDGIQLQNLIYIGVSKDVKRRFSEGHEARKQFELLENLEKATLFEQIESDKALLLGRDLQYIFYFTF
ncbi:unnamed protein product [Meloidogyne enterolobii]|uniref:Uncharacterized protein n=1 Tax=Meloidogyne enterolobii TaxID=390850 RepID=A0ACB0XTY5_MELEN